MVRSAMSSFTRAPSPVPSADPPPATAGARIRASLALCALWGCALGCGATPSAPPDAHTMVDAAVPPGAEGANRDAGHAPSATPRDSDAGATVTSDDAGTHADAGAQLDAGTDAGTPPARTFRLASSGTQLLVSGPARGLQLTDADLATDVLVPAGLMTSCPCDYDPTWCSVVDTFRNAAGGAASPDAAFIGEVLLKAFGTMGLRDYEGHEKPALMAAWQAARAQPLTP